MNFGFKFHFFFSLRLFFLKYLRKRTVLRPVGDAHSTCTELKKKTAFVGNTYGLPSQIGIEKLASCYGTFQSKPRTPTGISQKLRNQKLQGTAYDKYKERIMI